MPYAYGSKTIMTRSATAFNAFTRLIKPIAQRGGLSLRFDTQALRLEWSHAESPRGRRALSRHAERRTTSASVVERVVLAAGAVNSAQLLMESANPEFRKA